MEAANILSTAIIFARSVKKQRNILNQIINVNKITSEINFYLVRIQEIKAEENEGLAQYIEASKLYIGGARKAIEAAQSLKDAILAGTLFGYAEICFGKSYRSMGEHQRYIVRSPCVAAAYYNLACIHFEKAQRKFPVHAMADIKNAESFFKSCYNQLQKVEEQCKQLNRKPLDPSKVGEIDPKVIISEPEPIFYP